MGTFLIHTTQQRNALFEYFTFFSFSPKNEINEPEHLNKTSKMFYSLRNTRSNRKEVEETKTVLLKTIYVQLSRALER